MLAVINEMAYRFKETFECIPISSEKRTGKDEYVTFSEQFVKTVCDFSSQYGNNNSISYTAYNIVGNPNKFPDYGDYPQTFVMRTYGQWWDKAPSRLIDFMPQNNGDIVSEDYIDVEYSQAVYPIRVSIYETYNPGSVVRIWARSLHGHWFQLWSGPPQAVSHGARIFSPRLNQCDFKTKLLRLEFNHSLLDYYNEIDAVLLVGTSELIVPRNQLRYESLGSLLEDLRRVRSNNEDFYNQTPKYTMANLDITILKMTFHKHCMLYKSRITDNISGGKLVTKLEQHYHCVPPIEEAFNSLQQFLQEEFPKLIKEIHLSSPPSLCGPIFDAEKNLSPPSANNEPCGSFSALPDETVLQILKSLDLRSLCRLCTVNKHFNNIARDALLYTSLNLKPYWNCLDGVALNNLASRCQYLQRLDLSWCGNYGTIKPQDIINFLSTCGNLLTHLRFNCCRFVNDAVLHEISRVSKNLKELCLRTCTGITNDGFAKLESLECLERLELYTTTIETSTLCAILRRNPRMKHLNLAGIRHERLGNERYGNERNGTVLNIDEVALELGNSCQYLESVDFWKAQTLTPHGVRALARCVHLREVDFGWCGGIGAPGDCMRALLFSCRDLEKVFLPALRGLTDRDLEPLLLCQNLKQLDLLGARSLTPDICYGFLLCCHKLQMIDLSFCDGISTAKIQEWRQQYPHISIKRSF